MQINRKSITRIAAIQVMYDYENNKGDIDHSINNIYNYYKDIDVTKDFDESTDSKTLLRPSYNFLKQLINFTHNDLNTLDIEIVNSLTHNQNINDLSKIIRSIFRIAFTEIKHFKQTSSKVIINEYTNIAADMLNDIEIGFVNSVLDKYTKKVRDD